MGSRVKRAASVRVKGAAMHSRTCRLSSGVLRTGRRLLNTWRAARTLSCPVAVGGRALRGRELCGGAPLCPPLGWQPQPDSLLSLAEHSLPAPSAWWKTLWGMTGEMGRWCREGAVARSRAGEVERAGFLISLRALHPPLILWMSQQKFNLHEFAYFVNWIGVHTMYISSIWSQRTHQVVCSIFQWKFQL